MAIANWTESHTPGLMFSLLPFKQTCPPTYLGGKSITQGFFMERKKLDKQKIEGHFSLLFEHNLDWLYSRLDLLLSISVVISWTKSNLGNCTLPALRFCQNEINCDSWGICSEIFEFKHGKVIFFVCQTSSHKFISIFE